MDLEISCPGCHRKIQFSGEAPRFCHECGKSLGSTQSRIINPDGSHQAAPLLANSDATVAPSMDPTNLDLDGTIAPTNAPFVPESPSAPGDIVGPYQLVRWLGAGGMGTVWEAIETKTGRRVALKRLSKTMATDDTYVQRFVREARLAAQISHPKVTFIYGSGSEEGQPYIAMELMPGRTLDDMVKEEGPLPIAIGIDKIIDCVEGLTAAHQLGMIHRDIKPSNCFLDTDESVKVGDFGLSKSLLNPDVSLTQTGTFMGTPSYAAPEQIRGAKVDSRTDIYSVGATLFYVLTGRTPFVGDAMSVTAQIISDPAPSMQGISQKIPKGLDAVVAKCLAKEPTKRFQTLEELRLALIPYASGQDSIMGIGRRFAAFMIDQSLIYVIYVVIMMGFTILTTFLNGLKGVDAVNQQAAMHSEEMGNFMLTTNLMLLVGNCLYFVFFEGIWGRGLGKRILGLRVVDSEGQSPGILRMFIRSIGIPGCFGLCFLWLYLSVTTIGLALDMTPTGNVASFAVSIVVYILSTLICVSTMRTTNRFLGLHGKLSGTRVIQSGTGKAQLHVPVVLPKEEKLEPIRFGPYESKQMMGESQLGKVFFGHDELLKRNVWVILRQQGTEPKIERLNLARVTRQRWLEGGNLEDGSRWDAFEAVNGVPVQTLVGLERKGDWSHYQQVMAEIIEEVREAIDDGTLPPSLSLAQVWLDKDGHARLLDKRLVNLVESEESKLRNEKSETKPVENSVKLVQELGDLFRRTSVLPDSAQKFINELNGRPKTRDTLAWAGNRLVSLSKKLPSITWDSRLGILATTLGVELVVYMLIAGFLFLLCFYVLQIPDSLRIWVEIGLASIPPAILGYLFRGGPVFHFMGIQVCNSRGLPAAKLICAVRNVLSWLPVVSLVGGVYLSLVLMESGDITPDKMGDPDALPEEHVNLLLTNSLILLGSMFAIVVGLFVAIASYKRGLVDFLLGTRLMPK